MTNSRTGDTPTGCLTGSVNRAPNWTSPMYIGCPEIIRRFWVSWQPVAWPWCNLEVSQRRPYCASVNSHFPVGLVSRQWDAVDWTCVLCDRHMHNNRATSDNAPAHSTALVQAFFLGGGEHLITQVCQPPYSPNLALCDFRLFPKLKSPLKGRRCVNATVTKYRSLVSGSHCRLTSPKGEWLFTNAQYGLPWLPRYKATQPILEIFKMIGYFPDRPHTTVWYWLSTPTLLVYRV